MLYLSSSPSWLSPALLIKPGHRAELVGHAAERLLHAGLVRGVEVHREAGVPAASSAATASFAAASFER